MYVVYVTTTHMCCVLCAYDASYLTISNCACSQPETYVENCIYETFVLFPFGLWIFQFLSFLFVVYMCSYLYNSNLKF